MFAEYFEFFSSPLVFFFLTKRNKIIIIITHLQGLVSCFALCSALKLKEENVLRKAKFMKKKEINYMCWRFFFDFLFHILLVIFCCFVFVNSLFYMNMKCE